MSDDLREREPSPEGTDVRPGDGIRTDNAGTGAGLAGPAPAGGDPDNAERVAEGPAGNVEPPGGMGTSAGGGHGTGSDRQSSGGSGEGEAVAGDEPQTDWLRGAEGQPESGSQPNSPDDPNVPD
jgi:hypothetical protein